MTSDTGKWVCQDETKAKITAYDADKGAKIQALTSSSTGYNIVNTTEFPDSIIFEWEIGSTEKATNDNTPMRVAIYQTNAYAVIIRALLNYTTGTSWGSTRNSNYKTWEKATYQAIYTPTKQILKRNGVTIITQTNDFSSYENVRIGFYQAYSSYFWCKNVKVKPYSE